MLSRLDMLTAQHALTAGHAHGLTCSRLDMLMARHAHYMLTAGHAHGLMLMAGHAHGSACSRHTGTSALSSTPPSPPRHRFRSAIATAIHRHYIATAIASIAAAPTLQPLAGIQITNTLIFLLTLPMVISPVLPAEDRAQVQISDPFEITIRPGVICAFRAGTSLRGGSQNCS